MGEEILKHNLPRSCTVMMERIGHHPPTEDPVGFVNEVRPFLKGN